jgi:subtilase family serine protease
VSSTQTRFVLRTAATLHEQLHTKESPRFHQFLTADQWNAQFAPAAEDEQVVVDWAQSQGLAVTQRYANRLIVDVEGSAATVEKAFGVTLNLYGVGASTRFRTIAIRPSRSASAASFTRSSA